MPLTVNEPLAPEIVPGVVVPSPQSMEAVNADAVSLEFPSLKVATLWLLALPSVTEVSRKSPGASPTMALLMTAPIWPWLGTSSRMLTLMLFCPLSV